LNEASLQGKLQRPHRATAL